MWDCVTRLSRSLRESSKAGEEFSSPSLFGVRLGLRTPVCLARHGQEAFHTAPKPGRARWQWIPMPRSTARSATSMTHCPSRRATFLKSVLQVPGLFCSSCSLFALRLLVSPFFAHAANVLAWVLSRQPCCLFLRRFESKDLAAFDAWFRKVSSSRRVCAQFCHCTLRYNTQHWLLGRPLHLRQDQCMEACVAGQCMAAFAVAVFIKPLVLPR